MASPPLQALVLPQLNQERRRERRREGEEEGEERTRGEGRGEERKGEEEGKKYTKLNSLKILIFLMLSRKGLNSVWAHSEFYYKKK